MTRDEAVAAVVRAWTDAGSAPRHHAEWQVKLRSEWPTLADAVEALVADHQRRGPTFIVNGQPNAPAPRPGPWPDAGRMRR